MPESNRRPHACKARALPTELIPLFLVTFSTYCIQEPDNIYTHTILQTFFFMPTNVTLTLPTLNNIAIISSNTYQSLSILQLTANYMSVFGTY